jgi:hypothetical protein
MWKLFEEFVSNAYPVVLKLPGKEGDLILPYPLCFSSVQFNEEGTLMLSLRSNGVGPYITFLPGELDLTQETGSYLASFRVDRA